MNTTDSRPDHDSNPLLGLGSSAGLGPLPTQLEGQYLTMTICGTSDDPAERGHWSSPAHVQWRVDKAVAQERERWARVRELALQCAGWHLGDGDDCGEISRELHALLEGPNVLVTGRL